MAKEIFHGPDGIKLEVDPAENYEGGTPALVVFPNGDTGTFNCVTCEGETADGTPTTKEQHEWLMSMTDDIDEMLGDGYCG